MQAVPQDSLSSPACGHSVSRPLSYAFIVAPARSGSTLLQTVLNSAGPVCIRGENAGIGLELVRSSRNARGKREKFCGYGKPAADSPWFGFDSFDHRAFRDDIRRVITERLLRPEPTTVVTGFKEVRWNFFDLQPEIQEMKAVFPGAKFVFNVRDPRAMSISGQWPDNPNALVYLESVVLAIREAAEQSGSDGMLVEYEDWAASPEAAGLVLEFLGQESKIGTIETLLSRKLTHPG